MASLGTKTHLVLITDLYECGDAKSMPPRAAAIKQSGVTLIVLLAWPSSSVTHVARPAARIASPNIARAILGTAVYEPTGNLAMVMKVMGHTDARTAIQYQHPALDPIREAID